MDWETLKEKLHYDPQTGIFTRKIDCGSGVRSKAGDVVGSHHHKGYRQIWIGNRNYLAHRLAWFYVYGIWPKQIDHINRIKDDNRISNLRDVSSQVNQFNKGLMKNNKSGVTGVHWCKVSGKWIAQVKVDGRSTHVGSFKTIAEASIARQKKVSKLLGGVSSH